MDRPGPLTGTDRPATPLADVVAASETATATTSRTAKAEALAALLGQLRPDEVEAVIGWLTGDARQGRIGVGWATVAGLTAEPATEPSLTVADLDTALDEVAVTTGPGSVGRRNEILGGLLVRATAAEADFVRRLLVGELRQGALEGVMVDAIARASEVPAAVVRRAHMLGGRLGPTARLALFEGREALEAVGLEVGRGVRPMLAATAAGVEEALAELGTCSVEWKLDGARIQVHRRGDEVDGVHPQPQRRDRPPAGRGGRGPLAPGPLRRARRRDADDGRGGPTALLPGLDVAVRRRRDPGR